MRAIGFCEPDELGAFYANFLRLRRCKTSAKRITDNSAASTGSAWPRVNAAATQSIENVAPEK
ncbi:hypothetical protein ACSFA8_24710 [Variovorax sp. RT4R15]|uniref:hypothetical protein n=1 Tax=Variovorax sp. RT4R15 TaxID=3443737 RepID=UPI003F486E30